jgi:hypothetical protein
VPQILVPVVEAAKNKYRLNRCVINNHLKKINSTRNKLRCNGQIKTDTGLGRFSL